MLRAVHSSRNVESKTSDLRGPSCIQVTSNIHKDAVALISSEDSGTSQVLFKHLERCRSVNFPQASGPRTHARLRFCLNTQKDIMCVNFSKARGLRDLMQLRSCLTTQKDVVVLISSSVWFKDSDMSQVLFKHLERYQCVLIFPKQEVWRTRRS